MGQLTRIAAGAVLGFCLTNLAREGDWNTLIALVAAIVLVMTEVLHTRRIAVAVSEAVRELLSLLGGRK